MMKSTGAGSESSCESTLTVMLPTPVIGAEISGVDLREPLTAEVCVELRRLLLRHRVLFLRDQQIDTAGLVKFAQTFGPIMPYSGVASAHAEYPEVQIATRNAGWHIDASGAVAAPYATVLRAVTIPPVGGDTIWANLVAAYEGLSGETKQTLNGLYLTHSSLRFYRERDTEDPLISYPAVRTHPETNEKVLHINLLAEPLIVGWDRKESDRLVRLLKDEATRPEYQVRFRWSQGAVAIWDNRAVHHYGVNDYGDSPRRMERILIANPTP
jgi:alpha-ketoglutarate-dependent taurine dioxygenase